MNRHLQRIQDFIQHAATLSAEEKAVLAKAVKDTDTEITVTEFKLDRTEKVKRTTAILLEETIEELEKKRKAVEEKNRDLEIEASLERVRTVAMGMRKPDDMLDVCRVICSQLETLEVKEIRNVQTAIIYEAKESYVNYEYYRLHDKTIITEVDYDDNPIQAAFVKQMLEGHGAFFNRSIEGAAVKEWLEYQKTTKVFIDNHLADATSLNYYWYSMGPVALGMSTYAPLSKTDLAIFERFRNVFGLAYTRYLDVETALTQTREAQIQLALERVRARTMAMQKSDELADTASVLFQQIKELGFETWSCGFCIWQKNDLVEAWMGADSGGLLPSMMLPYKNEPTHRKIYESFVRGDVSHENVWEGQELAAHYAFMKGIPSIKDALNVLEEAGLALPVKQCYNVGFFKQGYLLIITKQPNADLKQLCSRFSVVFEQTYTRFLDLQKSEVQAREGQIELALERVRARTMAMQRSEELAETVFVLFQQFKELGEDPDQATIGIVNEDEGVIEYWVTMHGNLNQHVYKFSLEEPNVTRKIYAGWKEQKKSLVIDLAGKALSDFMYYRAGMGGAPFNEAEKRRVINVAFFSKGLINVQFTESYSEDSIRLLERFAAVFDGTYTRFLDLQKAETQAREAIKQTSLDRVRGEIASMRTTKDLERIIPLVWNELTILGIPFIRCGVFIIDEEVQLIHTHLSTPDGKAIAAFELPFDAEGIGRDMLPAWRKKQMATVHWSAEEFAGYTKTLVAQGAIKSKGKYVTERPDTPLDLHFFPFSQGMLYAGNAVPLSSNEKDMVQSLADAFSTAYARYEDFNKLEAAKQQVENTLTDLKAAQTQLIQSEKMASLGELTAGIAHEIQNPLNFVNNFSEVNQEMIDELTDELKAGNIVEALAIAADIRQNEEKINHHGKRADGIVKGMLQHSRSGAGEKQPTNLNAIADEFFKLSYHGHRAKNKTFNAKLIADYDDTLPAINVLPQDIGRVMLNLFNNAFYAVSQKAKAAGAGYKPTVTVTTFAPTGGGWAAKVRDNGVGMPDSIKVKIMQPFFTTKPTGEGTGLGLSLTYDMVVKGHGGSIAVDTKEGEFTEFTITLPR